MTTMQLNDQGRSEKEAAACEMCGHGFSPDERMNFEGSTAGSLIAAAYQHLADMRDKMNTTECILAKLMELQKTAA